MGREAGAGGAGAGRRQVAEGKWQKAKVIGGDRK